jgi:hypothetical protein
MAFLEQQVAELGRASQIDKARLEHLREIESSRGYRLLRRYYLLAAAPVTGPVIRLLRRVARRVLHPVRGLCTASGS